MRLARAPGRLHETAEAQIHDSVRVGSQSVTASWHRIDEMRPRLLAVPLIERSDIAYRASSMLRQARNDGQLRLPLRADLEDAVAMLVVLGITAVHT
jgi:hypothetical protein